MNKEDYFKYYIQGSDHYLIPKDVFDEMESWKEEARKLKKQLDKALNFIDCHFKEMVADEEAQELKSILKESGE